MLEQLLRGAFGLTAECGLAIWRTRQAQDAFAMHVEVEWIERDVPIGAAHGDDRHLGVEWHEIFVEQRCGTERGPRRVEIRRIAQHELSLAVVAEAPRLEHAREPDAAHGEAERGARIDRGVTRRRYAQQLEGALLGETVLRGGERAQRRRDARVSRQTLERIDRDVLPVEG